MRVADDPINMNAAGVSIEDLPLRFDVAESVVEQFALSHAPADILRELVQNEYDAGGHELGVHFGSDRLVITGDGNPIDAAGWNRLRVMLGLDGFPTPTPTSSPRRAVLAQRTSELDPYLMWVTRFG